MFSIGICSIPLLGRMNLIVDALDSVKALSDSSFTPGSCPILDRNGEKHRSVVESLDMRLAGMMSSLLAVAV